MARAFRLQPRSARTRGKRTVTSCRLALPFLLGTALVFVLLSRGRSPRLAYTGGILLAIGFVYLSAVAGYETLAVMLVQDGRFDVPALSEALDEPSPAAMVMFLMFIPFALFGLLTSAAALWRSRAVPLGAVLLIPAFIVVDFFLNEGFGIVPSSAAHGIELVAFSWIASAVLRGTSEACGVTALALASPESTARTAANRAPKQRS